MARLRRVLAVSVQEVLRVDGLDQEPPAAAGVACNRPPRAVICSYIPTGQATVPPVAGNRSVAGQKTGGDELLDERVHHGAVHRRADEAGARQRRAAVAVVPVEVTGEAGEIVTEQCRAHQ